MKNRLYRGCLGVVLVALTSFGFVGMSIASTPDPVSTSPEESTPSTGASCKEQNATCNPHRDQCCGGFACLALGKKFLCLAIG